MTISPRDMTACHKAALDYLSMGYAVLPIILKDKKPLLKWKQYEDRVPSEDEVNCWFKQYPNAQVGIVTGSVNNLIVVDVDAKYGGLESVKKLHLPSTLTVKTGGGGFHYYYQLPKGIKILDTKRHIAPGIDIRAEGGLVIAPPSVHKSGNKYEFCESQLVPSGELTELPKEILEFLKSSKSKCRFEDIILGVPEGSRNDSMASFVGSIIKVMPVNEWQTKAWAAAQELNRLNKPPVPVDELSATFKSICRLEHESRLNNTKNKNEVPLLEVASDKPVEFQITTCRDFLTMEIKPFPWLVYGLIPEGAITAISSDTGKGKSLFALIFSKAIAKGEKLFGQFEVKKSKVLIIDQEMDRDTVASRYQAIMGNEEVAVDCILEQDLCIDKPEHFERLKNKVIEGEYNVVIFDTLTTIHNLRENEADDMKVLNKLFFKFIRETKTAIIYLHHNRKTVKGEKPSSASARGSTEIVAKAASHLVLDSRRTKDEQGRTINTMFISQEKARRPECPPPFCFDAIYDHTTKRTEVIFRGEVEVDTAAIVMAKNKIVEYLRENGGEATINVFKSKLLLGESNIRKACKQLVSEEVLDSHKGDGAQWNTCYYFLKQKI